MIETAFVFPLAMITVLLAFNAEWSIFQVQELRDAANAAVGAVTIDSPSSPVTPIDASNCDNGDRILDAIRKSAAVLPIPAGSRLCIPGNHSNVLQLRPPNNNITICITAEPTVYTPSHATVVVTDHIAILGFSLFPVTANWISQSTTGATGVPGTSSYTAPQDPNCPY